MRGRNDKGIALRDRGYRCAGVQARQRDRTTLLDRDSRRVLDDVDLDMDAAAGIAALAHPDGGRAGIVEKLDRNALRGTVVASREAGPQRDAYRGTLAVVLTFGQVDRVGEKGTGRIKRCGNALDGFNESRH